MTTVTQMSSAAMGPTQVSSQVDSSAVSQAQLMAGYQQYMNQLGGSGTTQYSSGLQGYYTTDTNNAVAAPTAYNEDPYAAYMAAAQQQQAAAYYGNYMNNGLGAYYGGTNYSSPAYYDPHGMINPAACVAPVQTQMVSEGHVSSNKGGRRKKTGGWCC